MTHKNKNIYSEIPFISVRTKIDRTLLDCMHNFPKTFNDTKTVALIRRRFSETAENVLKYSKKLPTFVLSATKPDFWDFRKFVQGMSGYT